MAWTCEGGSVTVVIHHSGRRDIQVFEGGDEPRAAVALSDSQARTLGAILGGDYFKPAVVEEIEAVIGGLPTPLASRSSRTHTTWSCSPPSA